jgi:transposase-like protein
MQGSRDVLIGLLRHVAESILDQAVEAEVCDWLEQHGSCRDNDGRQQVVRNGFLPVRRVLTCLGEVAIKRPRVLDRRPAGLRERFCSSVVLPYRRRTRSSDESIPWLFLKGIITGEFEAPLAALLCLEAGASSSKIAAQLKDRWQEEWQSWSQRSFAGKQYTRVWADVVNFSACPVLDRPSILVLMGATAECIHEIIAVSDGQGDSEQSWSVILKDCQNRGLTAHPELAIGHGALGFWKAIAKVWPRTRAEPCWAHKSANFADDLWTKPQSSTRFVIG